MLRLSSGITNNKKIGLFFAITLIALVTVFLLYVKLTAPNKDSVDGVYHNECCEDIIIKNGLVSYGNSTLDMRLLNMKFGLTGYVDARFTNREMQTSKEATAIIFSDRPGMRTLTLPIGRNDYIFQKTESFEERDASKVPSLP